MKTHYLISKESCHDIMLQCQMIIEHYHAIPDNEKMEFLKLRTDNITQHITEYENDFNNELDKLTQSME